MLIEIIRLCSDSCVPQNAGSKKRKSQALCPDFSSCDTEKLCFLYALYFKRQPRVNS